MSTRSFKGDAFEVTVTPRRLQFRRRAETSRGELHDRPIWLLEIRAADGACGVGEIAPLTGLSPELSDSFEPNLENACQALANGEEPAACAPREWASIRCGIEMALADLQTPDLYTPFPGKFALGVTEIPINGLVWMNDIKQMRHDAEALFEAGFRCLKFKIGSLQWGDELALLTEMRALAGGDLELRVDANGAFEEDVVLDRLDELAGLDVHSIEQPVSAGQPDLMRRVAGTGLVPVALDEELIGIHLGEDREALLDRIRPQYLILKPSLLSGFESCREWISLAEARGIGWWMTSALESNVGLNAIAQFTSSFENPLCQGLGTGGLFENNIDSPLVIRDAALHLEPTRSWGVWS